MRDIGIKCKNTPVLLIITKIKGEGLSINSIYHYGKYLSYRKTRWQISEYRVFFYNFATVSKNINYANNIDIYQYCHCPFPNRSLPYDWLFWRKRDKRHYFSVSAQTYAHRISLPLLLLCFHPLSQYWR